VPAEYPTIQDAINDCNDGDTVIIDPNTYTGPGNRDIDFLGKAITVRSTDPNDPNIVAATIIDCNGTETEPHRGFRFWQGEDANSVVAGLTIINGYAPLMPGHRTPIGGAIYCVNSSPTIRQCVIRDNLAGVGGGIYCGESESIISNCEITGNSARYGGGIRLYSCQSDISNCLITDNTAWERNGGGVIISWGDAAITNCTISNNVADRRISGGMYCDEATVTITNCIFWDNSPSEISEGPGGNATATYCDIKGGWPGEGNIESDPCFVKPGYWDVNSVWVEGDYHLLRTSPCVDAGNDANVYTDIEGNIRPFDFPGVDNNGELPEFDMGAYELVPVEAAMKLTPQMLNCRGKGKYVKAHITLPEGFLPEDVDVNAPAVAEPMGAYSEYIKVLGAGTGLVRLEITFDREAFCAQITETGEIEITVIGSLTAGRYFYATDTIKMKPRR